VTLETTAPVFGEEDAVSLDDLAMPPEEEDAVSLDDLAMPAEETIAHEKVHEQEHDHAHDHERVQEQAQDDDAELDEDSLVIRWAEALDHVDYLTVLNLPPPMSEDEVPGDRDVRAAFTEFALRFHPDRYRESPDLVRQSAAKVFQLGTEALRVLRDPLVRKRYVKMLVAGEGRLRLTPEEIGQALIGDTKRALSVLEMSRTAAARPYAMKTDELLKLGDLKHARLQLQLCMMRDPANFRLEERMKELDAEIATKK
jgi:hypothetical protein